MLVDDFVVAVIGFGGAHNAFFIAGNFVKPLTLRFTIRQIGFFPSDFQCNGLVQLFIAGGGQDLGDGVGALLQAIEGGVQSLLVSLLRQLIFVLPAAWLFARLLPAGVWLAFPIAEVLTAVIAAVLLLRTAGKGRLSQQDHAVSLSK